MKSIGAILAGFLVIVVLSIGTDTVMHALSIFPPMGKPMADSLWLLATVYRAVYGIIGGYIAARLAPDRPMLHALGLGVLGLLAGLAGGVVTWNEGPAFGPKWFALALVALPMPTCQTGGGFGEAAWRKSRRIL